MAQFYSDLVNWSCATLVGSAVLLIQADLVPGDAEGEAPAGREPVLIASADPAGAEILRSANSGPADEVVAAAVTEPVTAAEPIRQATLEAVRFTTIGLEENPYVPSALATPDVTEPGPLGLVTGRAVNIRSGPGTGNPVVGQAVRNDELEVTGEAEGAWVQVVLPQTGERAWIHGNFFLTPDRRG